MSFNSKKTRPPRALPFVLVNMAMTADGKIATGNRAVSSFGSPRDHDHLYELRATADAVMAGARTVDLNAVAMDAGEERFRKLRLKHGLAAQNLRIIVSGSGTIDPQAHIFRQHFSPIIVLTTQRMKSKIRAQLKALGAVVKICGRRKLALAGALRWLANEWGVRRLLCEGGGELNSALFLADLVDEVHLTVCPKLFGGSQAPTIAEGVGFPRLADAAPFQLRSTRQIADEMFLIYAKRRPSRQN